MVTGKRVLVTGGAGFLGSHLCEQLLARGHDVLCVDNFFSSSRHNVAHLLDSHSMELLRHDITFPLFVEVDEIFNLACPASPVYYQSDPTQTTKTIQSGYVPAMMKVNDAPKHCFSIIADSTIWRLR
jgi:UDP-glucuronate decarboxylase